MDPYEEAIDRAKTTMNALMEVSMEREAQDVKWGEQNHPNGTGDIQLQDKAKLQRAKTNRLFRTGSGTWRDILEEEVAEALAEHDPQTLRAELVQVAAVAVAWIEAIDRGQS